MKKILFFATLFFSFNAFSYDGVVIVLQASLLKAPDDNSTILQNVRKGEKIYIPPFINLKKALPEFLPTYDRAGNVAYIRSHHIKIVTNDEQERQWPISIGDYDPTDYRIEEPIPPTYPFLNHQFGRASIELSMGNNPLSPYKYDGIPISQNYSYERGIRFTAMRKVSFDKTDRYYFGIIGGGTQVVNSLTFDNGQTADESRYLLRAGPFFSYDAFKTSSFRLSVGTGVTYNYHISNLSMSDNSALSERRQFNGYSLSPMLSIAMERDKIIPGIDLMMGTDLYFFLPHSQTAPKSSSSLAWNGDKIQSAARTQVSFFIGVQTKY